MSVDAEKYEQLCSVAAAAAKRRNEAQAALSAAGDALSAAARAEEEALTELHAFTAKTVQRLGAVQG